MDKLNHFLLKHQSAIEKCIGSFGPKTDTKIVVSIAKSQAYPVHLYLSGLIKVLNGIEVEDVDLRNRCYSCKAWQMLDIPCKHVCATLHLRGFKVVDYVDDCLKKSVRP